MRLSTKIVFTAVALAAAPMAALAPQAARAADVDVSVNPGIVAFGYSDGYWDRGHAWHAWHNDHDRDAYRHSRNAEYHEWKHDRDRDMGWHERHY